MADFVFMAKYCNDVNRPMLSDVNRMSRNINRPYTGFSSEVL